MSIAYIISAYKNARQLERLIRRLDGEGVHFLVHIDQKSPIFSEVGRRLRDLQNVRFLDRHRCVWGGFGHVAATIEGINALGRDRLPGDYVVLLTGQDYPIKPHQQICEVLEKAEGRSFMEYFPLPSDVWDGGGLDRIRRWHVRWFKRYFVFPRSVASPFARRFPRGFQPFGGSSYWCLARACADYLYEFVATNPRFVRFFHYVDVPDEIVFQTILLNSSLRDHIVNDNLRHIEWRDPQSGSPAILTTDDFAELAASPKLFARKFDVTVDAKVLDMIDEQILGVATR